MIKVLELYSSLLLVREIFLKFREKEWEVTILCRKTTLLCFGYAHGQHGHNIRLEVTSSDGGSAVVTSVVMANQTQNFKNTKAPYIKTLFTNSR